MKSPEAFASALPCNKRRAPHRTRRSSGTSPKKLLTGFSFCLVTLWPALAFGQSPLSNTEATAAQMAHLFVKQNPVLYFCQEGVLDDLGNLDGDWGQGPTLGRITSAAWDVGGNRYLYAYQLTSIPGVDGGDPYGNWDVAVSGHSSGLKIPLRHKQVIPVDFDGNGTMDTSFRLTDHACSADIAQGRTDCAPLQGAFSVFTTGPDACAHSFSDYYVVNGANPHDGIVNPRATFDVGGNSAEFFAQYDPLCCAHGIIGSTQIFGFVSDAPPAYVDGVNLGGASASIRIVAPVPHVLLVHGICGDAGAWDPYFSSALADSGYEVAYFSYGEGTGAGRYNKQFTEYVNAIGSKIDAMGVHSVSVVGHSMGGLIAREYMRRQTLNGDRNKIAQLVMLGAPNHGSDLDALALSLTPLSDIIAKWRNTDPCLTNANTQQALWAQVPGTYLLNRLNYGGDGAIYDVPWRKPYNGRGWKSHHMETALPSNVYSVEVGGTGTFCNSVSRELVWGRPGSYHNNDCTVATNSALLENTSTVRAPDVNLFLPQPVAHTNAGTIPCDVPYYASATLGRRVARILLASPPNVPELGASTQAPLEVSSTQDDDESLEREPLITASVPNGQITNKVAVIPATTFVRFALFSTDAHLTLVDPNGSAITPSDATPGSGITFGADDGLEGFDIVDPLSGAWTLRIDATTSPGFQNVAGLVEYSTPSELRLSLDDAPLHPGDVIHVLGQLNDGTNLRTDVTWSCSVLRPDNVLSDLTLYDDGAHGDGQSGDGVYGNTLTPSGGVGLYAVTATASAPGVGPFATTTYSVLDDSQDLAVSANEIRLSKNLPEAGDALTVYATVHNNSSKAALGVVVEIRDRRADTVLGTSTIDLAAGAAATIQAPWVPAPPDSHDIEVKVSPFVLDESDYTNNKALRTFVLGVPVGVGSGIAGADLRLEPPYPNPAAFGMMLWFSLPRASAASLDVFDIIGRRVRSWRWTSLSVGGHSVAWDGRGPSGELLAPGVYVCRLQVGNQCRRQKLVLRR